MTELDKKTDEFDFSDPYSYLVFALMVKFFQFDCWNEFVMNVSWQLKMHLHWSEFESNRLHRILKATTFLLMNLRSISERLFSLDFITFCHKRWNLTNLGRKFFSCDRLFVSLWLETHSVMQVLIWTLFSFIRLQVKRKWLNNRFILLLMVRILKDRLYLKLLMQFLSLMVVNKGYVQYFQLGALAYPSNHNYLLLHLYQKTKMSPKLFG